ncbi:MAG: hypothetical protein P8J70_07915 [Glaciecola sp.]|jgi:hypothetical protein|nr:hypothetical protein [Glaciecola sp.]MDG1814482.1 hypothetical protein [Glaciecola sp.]MDG2099586.1 hypothetical protein [Glaciecola sp.]
MNDFTVTAQQVLPLAYADAEVPISGAPSIPINPSQQCIPQHYLQYQHTHKSVSDIVNDIQFDERYPVFVSIDESSLVLQVGILGRDNYKTNNAANPLHIVYGRKWRVEKNLPSAEIIQTVFLALQKAKEHEIREVFTLLDNHSGKHSTPFSGHHDTPLLASTIATSTNTSAQPATNKAWQPEALQRILGAVKFDGQKLHLTQCIALDTTRVVADIELRQVEAQTADYGTVVGNFFPEFTGAKFSLVLTDDNANTLYHQLMQQFITLSNEHVAERFTYRGFTRFSRSVNVAEIGATSIAIRAREWRQEASFMANIKAFNQQVDATRVPVLQADHQAAHIVQRYEHVAGHKPILKKVLFTDSQ